MQEVVKERKVILHTGESLASYFKINPGFGNARTGGGEGGAKINNPMTQSLLYKCFHHVQKLSLTTPVNYDYPSMNWRKIAWEGLPEVEIVDQTKIKEKQKTGKITRGDHLKTKLRQDQADREFVRKHLKFWRHIWTPSLWDTRQQGISLGTMRLSFITELKKDIFLDLFRRLAWW